MANTFTAVRKVALMVIAKEPLPGRAKTRLSPPCTPAEAAAIAEAALLDTLEVVASTPAARKVLVFDGDPRRFARAGLEIIQQRGGGLAERLAAAFDDVAAPALLIGMDTPQLTRGLLLDGIRALSGPTVDAVLGRAADGGYWSIGLKPTAQRVFDGVPMSRSTTWTKQRARLRELGLRIHDQLPLRDVDTIEDARAVAVEAPGSRFAAALAAVAAMTHPLSVYEQGLLRGTEPRLRLRDGAVVALPLDRYLGAADTADRQLLNGIRGPVLDVGCGPGRHLHALAASGVFALGVDLSAAAVELARGGGARAVVGSIFDYLPGSGSWRSALLIDGNIGIGGHPARLLARIGTLLRDDGTVLVELAPPATPSQSIAVRLETDHEVSSWFPWALVSARDVHKVARRGGFRVDERWSVAGRWFARLAVRAG